MPGDQPNNSAPRSTPSRPDQQSNDSITINGRAGNNDGQHQNSNTNNGREEPVARMSEFMRHTDDPAVIALHDAFSEAVARNQRPNGSKE